MSDDPLARQLSRFTPDGTGLDRDALLFAAGKASARPVRWLALAAALAASQFVTLGLLLWSLQVPPTGDPLVAPAARLAVEPPQRPLTESHPPEPLALWTLSQRVFAGDGKLPAETYVDDPVPSEPPLRAFGALPAALVH
jgi:hypothetical protein